MKLTINGEPMQRTTTQNASLHKYFEIIAKQLADSGQDMRLLVKIPIIPTKENVKADLFKPFMTKHYPDIKSTTELDTKQMQFLYEVFNAALSERLGVGADWPSEESMYAESQHRFNKPPETARTGD